MNIKTGVLFNLISKMILVLSSYNYVGKMKEKLKNQ